MSMFPGVGETRRMNLDFDDNFGAESHCSFVQGISAVLGG